MENQVREFRKSRRLSLAGLAKISGVPASAIGDIERGAEPKLETAARLANALDATIYRLWPKVFDQFKNF